MNVGDVATGTLRLVPGRPNPDGAECSQLFLLAGDAAAAPVSEIVPAAGAALPPRSLHLSERPFRLTIVHVNDLHGCIARTTPAGDQPVLSKLVGRVRGLRRNSQGDPLRGVLFLSSGDDLAGGAVGELGDSVHAAYRLLSAAGLDAGAVGNHDLDAGPRSLAQAIDRDARFPLLSANLGCSPLAGRVHPAALLVIKGVRVGLIGLTTRAEIRGAPGMCLSHPLVAARNLVPALRRVCDVLIVLSHLGRSLASSSAATCDAGDVELAEALPVGSVDLIVGGHTHEALNEAGLVAANLVNGIPIVQAGAMGRFLGEVEAIIGARVRAVSAVLAPATDLQPDEAYEREQVRPLLEQIRPLLGRCLGRVADHLDVTTQAVREGFAAGESALANLIADGLTLACRAGGHPVDMAAIDASSIRCGLQPGSELTFGDWFELMPHADTVRLYRLTGRQLAALLDDNARRADRCGEPHLERGFLQFSRQLRYTIELGDSRQAAHAVQISVEGQRLDQHLPRTFVVACTSFVREAAGPWERGAARDLGPAAWDFLGLPEADTGLLVRDLLVAHLVAHGGATEEAGARRDGRLIFLQHGQPTRPITLEGVVRDAA